MQWTATAEAAMPGIPGHATLNGVAAMPGKPGHATTQMRKPTTKFEYEFHKKTQNIKPI